MQIRQYVLCDMTRNISSAAANPNQNKCSFRTILIDSKINEPNWKGVSSEFTIFSPIVPFQYHWKLNGIGRLDGGDDNDDYNDDVDDLPKGMRGGNGIRFEYIFDWILTLNVNPCKFLHLNCFDRTVRFVCWNHCHWWNSNARATTHKMIRQKNKYIKY